LIQLPKLTTCEICKGNGFTLEVNNKCNICSGDGKLPCENSVIINCRKALDVPSVCFPNEGHFNPLTNNYGKVVINFKTKNHDKFKKIGKYDISTHVDVSIIQTLIGCEGSIDHPKGHKVPFKTKTGEMISEGDICIIDKEGLTSEGQLLIIFRVKKQKKLSYEVVNELRVVFQKHNLI
jgi:DnaJ-class molecular chaperone